jgi:hypothetical protein
MQTPPELIIRRLLDYKRKYLGTLARVQHGDSAESYSMAKAVAFLALSNSSGFTYRR